MVGRTFLLGSLFLGSIAATPIAGPVAAVNVPEARAVEVAAPAAPLTLDALMDMRLRDVDYEDVVDTVAGWGKEYMATNFAPKTHSVHKRDIDFSEIIDTVVGWFKDWMHSGSSSSSSAPAGGNTSSVKARDLDYDNMVDTVGGWAKDYFRSDSAALTTRDNELNANIDTIAEKIKSWISGESTPKLQVRDMSALGVIIDDVVSWIETLFGTNDWGSILGKVIGWLAKIL